VKANTQNQRLGIYRDYAIAKNDKKL